MILIYANLFQLTDIDVETICKLGINALFLLSKFGDPGGIRTPDLCFRKALLYPAELRGLKSRLSQAFAEKNLKMRNPHLSLRKGRHL